MATKEEIAELKALVASLPEGTRAHLAESYRIRTQGPSNTPQSILAAAHLGGKQPTGKAREEFERGGVEGALAVPMTIAAVPAAVGAGTGLATAAAAGRTGLLAYGKNKLKRALVGAGIGGVLGETPVPIVGQRGWKEGSQLGALWAVGQGGKGALWKHGKARKAYEWIINKALGTTDEAAPAIVKVPPRIPPGMSGTPVTPAGISRAGTAAQQADEVAATVTRGTPRPGGVSRTPTPASAPAPPPAKEATDIVKVTKTGASRGAVLAARHKQMVTFAKEQARGHKFGEKVWMELNESGEPIRVMTPGQASRVAESAKTWIKKMWRD
jgi:hypothetical protein